jgi:Methyltransferase domain
LEPSFRLSALLVKAWGFLKSKTYSDDFLTWLTFANAGMLRRGNTYAIKYAIDRIESSNPVIEIGSFCGLSTNVIAHLLRSAGKANLFYTCDKWIFENSDANPYLGKSEISHSEYREFVKATFIRNVEFFSAKNKPHTIEVFSDDFFRLWNEKQFVADVFGRDAALGGPISFCYVDGNHTYEFAKRDFENIDRCLERGGFVLFDDSADGDPFGLTRLMREVEAREDYQLVMKNPNYLFRKV